MGTFKRIIACLRIYFARAKVRKVARKNSKDILKGVIMGNPELKDLVEYYKKNEDDSEKI